MGTKRLCTKFENEIHIYKLYSKNGVPIVDDKDFSNLYEYSIRCYLPRYMSYSDEEKRELCEKQGKKGCNGNCKHRLTKSEVVQIIAYIQDLENKYA